MRLEADLVWHNHFTDDSYDAAILPGGFSFGDHLRGGIIAAQSPAMDTVRKMAEGEKPVLGICNGFQTLIEAGLLPGALLPNSCLKFVCKWMNLEIENNESAFTCAFGKGAKVRMPIAHHEGRFFGEDDLLDQLASERRILMTYRNDNPTGASRAITALSNEKGNVVGMMPHPERASDISLGGDDGLMVFKSMMRWAER
jgi:phosphoribosylformylglycinamidine synthase